VENIDFKGVNQENGTELISKKLVVASLKTGGCPPVRVES
jgi:hypothetical protein